MSLIQNERPMKDKALQLEHGKLPGSIEITISPSYLHVASIALSENETT